MLYSILCTKLSAIVPLNSVMSAERRAYVNNIANRIIFRWESRINYLLCLYDMTYYYYSHASCTRMQNMMMTNWKNMRLGVAVCDVVCIWDVYHITLEVYSILSAVDRAACIMIIILLCWLVYIYYLFKRVPFEANALCLVTCTQGGLTQFFVFRLK